MAAKAERWQQVLYGGCDARRRLRADRVAEAADISTPSQRQESALQKYTTKDSENNCVNMCTQKYLWCCTIVLGYYEVCTDSDTWKKNMNNMCICVHERERERERERSSPGDFCVD